MDLALFDRVCRRDLVLHDPAYRVERTSEATRIVGPSDLAYENAVVWSNPRAGADATLDAEVAHFRSLGKGFEWKHFAHDAGPSTASLLARGFVAGDAETVLYLAVTGEPFDAPPAEIRRIDTASDLEAVAGVQECVYSDDFGWLAEGLGRELAHAPSSLAIHVAYLDETPVATGWIRHHGPIAYLHGGVTVPSARGRGLFRALVAARLRQARERGVSFVACDATAMSRPILERLGFRVATTTTPFTREPA